MVTVGPARAVVERGTGGLLGVGIEPQVQRRGERSSKGVGYRGGAVRRGSAAESRSIRSHDLASWAFRRQPKRRNSKTMDVYHPTTPTGIMDNTSLRRIWSASTVHRFVWDHRFRHANDSRSDGCASNTDSCWIGK